MSPWDWYRCGHLMLLHDVEDVTAVTRGAASRGAISRDAARMQSPLGDETMRS